MLYDACEVNGTNPARAPQFPSTFNPLHQQRASISNKGFINHLFFTHLRTLAARIPFVLTCSQKHPGGGGSPSQHFRPELGGYFSGPKAAESSLHCAARRAIVRREGRNRAAPVGMTEFGECLFGADLCRTLRGSGLAMNVRPGRTGGIPPLRGPTRHSSARRKKSGRSGRG